MTKTGRKTSVAELATKYVFVFSDGALYQALLREGEHFIRYCVACSDSGFLRLHHGCGVANGPNGKGRRQLECRVTAIEKKINRFPASCETSIQVIQTIAGEPRVKALLAPIALGVLIPVIWWGKIDPIRVAKAS